MAGRQHEPRWLKAARERNGREGVSLARALGRAGAMPRSSVEAAIRERRLTVDGAMAESPEALVRADSLVALDGERVSLGWCTRAFAFHKPAGFVCAAHDDEGIGTAAAAFLASLPTELRSFEWLSIGRLDRGTTGLLLFTNDAGLVAHVARPESGIAKRYLVRFTGTLTDAELVALREGVRLSDAMTRPAGAVRVGIDRIELTLLEGRHHQVKRMLAAIGLSVTELHRAGVGGVTLDATVGSSRELTADELRLGLGYSAISQ